MTYSEVLYDVSVTLTIIGSVLSSHIGIKIKSNNSEIDSGSEWVVTYLKNSLLHQVTRALAHLILKILPPRNIIGALWVIFVVFGYILFDFIVAGAPNGANDSSFSALWILAGLIISLSFIFGKFYSVIYNTCELVKTEFSSSPSYNWLKNSFIILSWVILLLSNYTNSENINSTISLVIIAITTVSIETWINVRSELSTTSVNSRSPLS